MRLFQSWRPSWSTQAVQVIELEMAEQEAVRLVERTIEAFDLNDGPIRHPEPRTIEATLKGDRTAFGNSVEVQMQPRGTAMTRLQITSKSIVPQLWDWGRNRSIVSRIASELLDRSGE